MGLTENVQNQENKETLLIIETGALQHFIPSFSSFLHTARTHSRTHTHKGSEALGVGQRHPGWVRSTLGGSEALGVGQKHSGWVRGTQDGLEAPWVGQKHSEWVKGGLETLGVCDITSTFISAGHCPNTG